MNQSNNVEVSVLCSVYNHKKYIKRCLEGFINQRTNFKYDVWVHDDCSTDGSIDIIEKYADKYPDTIIPYYEDENQHNKGIAPIRKYVFPKTKGKYIAICEGDDYWCDASKLQKQYDFMEENLDCSMCCHNTVWHDLRRIRKDKLFFDWKDLHRLTDEDIFLGWKVHTSSYFMRRDNYLMIDNLPKCYGDFKLLTWNYTKGQIWAMPHVMSVYNANNPCGAVCKAAKDWRIYHAEREERIKYLKMLDEITKGEYHKSITRSIEVINLKEHFEQLDNSISNNILNHKHYKKLSKMFTQDPLYQEYLHLFTYKTQLRIRSTHYSHFIFMLYLIRKGLLGGVNNPIPYCEYHHAVIGAAA